MENSIKYGRDWSNIHIDRRGFLMAENIENSIIPILKRYPIRPDNSINLTPEALRRIGWPAGTLCSITLDLGKKRIIIEEAQDQASSI